MKRQQLLDDGKHIVNTYSMLKAAEKTVVREQARHIVKGRFSSTAVRFSLVRAKPISKGYFVAFVSDRLTVVPCLAWLCALCACVQYICSCTACLLMQPRSMQLNDAIATFKVADDLRYLEANWHGWLLAREHDTCAWVFAVPTEEQVGNVEAGWQVNVLHRGKGRQV